MVEEPATVPKRGRPQKAEDGTKHALKVAKAQKIDKKSKKIQKQKEKLLKKKQKRADREAVKQKKRDLKMAKRLQKEKRIRKMKE